MQKITLILLCLLAFKTQAAKDIKTSFTFPDISEKIELTEGTGHIKGVVLDAESQNIIDDTLYFSAILYVKAPQFGDWRYVTQVEVNNSNFVFHNLPNGQYAVVVRWGGGFDPELITNFYVSGIWSNRGTLEFLHDQFKTEHVIEISEPNQIQEISMNLAKGSYFELSSFEADHTYQAYAYSESLNDGVYRNYLYSSTKTGIGNMGQTESVVSLIFVLPKGEFQFYAENKGFKSQILGGNSCEFCRLDINQGEGQSVALEQGYNDPLFIVLSLPSGQIKGEGLQFRSQNFELLSTYNKLVDYLYFWEFDDLYFQNVPSGYYQLKIKEFVGQYGNHEYLLGSSYCDELACQFDEARVFKVDSTGTTWLPPLNYKRGGAITGRVLDGKVINNQIIPEDDSNLNWKKHWVSFFDHDYKFVTDVEVDSDGNYRKFLHTGQYYVRTGSPKERLTNRRYVNQIYPNSECNGQYCDYSQAQLITVERNKITNEVNFELNRGFFISGNVVTGADNYFLPIANARVAIYDELQNFLMDVDTLSDGTFSIGGLQNGRYFIKTSNGNKYQHTAEEPQSAWGWLDEMYPDVPCPKSLCDFSAATLVEVNDQDVNGINFELKRSQFISGTIKDRNNGNPVTNATIHIHNAEGELINSYKSDSNGFFATNGLSLGSESAGYLLTVDGGPLYYNHAVGGEDCIYQDCTPDMATVINSTDLNLTIELNHKEQVDERYSGMWFNANESGHGLQFEVVTQGENQVLNVAWFAHFDGEPIWLTGAGLILGNGAYVDLSITDGTEFPESMNAEIWGTLRVTFNDLNKAQLYWDSRYRGRVTGSNEFESGSLKVERLTNLTEATEADGLANGINACMSGSYYDPERPGEGLFLEVLGEEGTTGLMTWYGYRGDNQFWLTGSETIFDDVLIAQVYYTYGVGLGFTPDFDSERVRTRIWGHVRIKKLSNSEIEVTLSPSYHHVPEFETTTTRLKRLTVISGDDVVCGLQ